MEEDKSLMRIQEKDGLLDDCPEIKLILRELALIKKLTDVGSQLGKFPVEWDSVKNLQLKVDELKKSGTICSHDSSVLQNFLSQLKSRFDDIRIETRNIAIDEITHFMLDLPKSGKVQIELIDSLVQNLREMRVIVPTTLSNSKFKISI